METRNYYLEQSPPAYEEIHHGSELETPPTYEEVKNDTQEPPPIYTIFEIDQEVRQPPTNSFDSHFNGVNVSSNSCRGYFVQTTSTSGGLFLLFVSGLHIGWGIWRVDFSDPWFKDGAHELFIFLIMSWYVGALIGGVIGALTVTCLQKKINYSISGAILASSSIMFIIWDKSEMIILAGRLLAGVAHGLVYNVTVTHIAENSAKENRGNILSIVNTMIMTGIFTSATSIALLPNNSQSGFNSSRLIGILGLTFSLIGISFSKLLTLESVHYLLRRDRIGEAVNIMIKLRPTSTITGDFQEIQAMSIEHVQESKNIFTDWNGPVLAHMIFTRIGTNFTNNLLFNAIMMHFTAEILGENYPLAAVIVILPRFILSIIPIFTMRLYKKGNAFALSLVFPMLLMLIFVGIAGRKPITDGIGVIIFTSMIFFQIFCGFRIDQMQHLYIAEIFPTYKKTWSISCVTAVENIFQILMVGIFFSVNPFSFETKLITLSVSIFYLIFFCVAKWPNTIDLTIKETSQLLRDGTVFTFLASKCSRYPY